jgi:membrane glycosyltransferase
MLSARSNTTTITIKTTAHAHHYKTYVLAKNRRAKLVTEKRDQLFRNCFHDSGFGVQVYY